MSDDVLGLPPRPTRIEFLATTRVRLLELASKGGGPKSMARRQAVIAAFRRRMPAFEPREISPVEVFAALRMLGAAACAVIIVVVTYNSGFLKLLAFAPIAWAVRDRALTFREPELERRIYAAECAELEALYLAQASEVPEMGDSGSDVVTAAALVQVAGKKRLVRVSRNTELPAEAELAALGTGTARLEIPILTTLGDEDRPWNTLVIRSPRKIAENKAILVKLTIGEDGEVRLVANAVEHMGGRLDAYWMDKEARFPVEHVGYR